MEGERQKEAREERKDVRKEGKNEGRERLRKRGKKEEGKAGLSDSNVPGPRGAQCPSYGVDRHNSRQQRHLHCPALFPKAEVLKDTSRSKPSE